MKNIKRVNVLLEMKEKHREVCEIFQKYFTKYFTKYFMPKNFMKFYITSYVFWFITNWF